jgi:NADH-quinone oxidoreductase subunit J
MDLISRHSGVKTMSTYDAIMAALIVILGASGTYLMLPHRRGRARPRAAYGAGAVACGAALLLFVSFWTPPGPFLGTAFFYVFSLAAITGGVLMVTTRNPIYSALYFAAVVLSTAGLFLLAGAPFLAAGTVIVYAGAIIVTFLFVIMLAQLEGRAEYDRAARAPGRASFTCFLLLWCLIYSLANIKPVPVNPSETPQEQRDAAAALPRLGDLGERLQVRSIVSVLSRASGPASQIRDNGGLEKPNVAGLGASLYTDHLISAGLAGALLFVALIGAVAIANPKRPP